MSFTEKPLNALLSFNMVLLLSFWLKFVLRDACFVFLYFCFAACFNFLTSSFTILSMACMTRCDFAASLSLTSLPKTVGTICHESPYLSLSQPHCTSLPPAESFLQNLSTSACVLQFTTNEMPSVNLKCGPPLSATNS